jgi:hypothetical protein
MDCGSARGTDRAGDSGGVEAAGNPATCKGNQAQPQSKENSMTKSVASETDVPKGLDVVPMEPGTIVGSRDLQGTDGKTRTDRPGEILGTPVAVPNSAVGRAKETAKHDFIRGEVDRANREELPRLGGTIDDGWKAAKSDKG